MARIRSIHPGFFTDEDIVSVSMAARICVIGLGVEADDKGTFEWKPLMLKMRLFPADNIDMGDILSELEAANVIRKFEIDGKQYGAIRNFRKFQKPKTPNDVHPSTDDIRKYVGLADDISETAKGKRDQFPPKGEKSFQMEDGGGKMEDGEESDQHRESEIPRERKAAKPAQRSGKEYAFSGNTIKLDAADLDRWKKTYHAIPDIEAELSAIDDWLRGKPAKQDDWFHITSGSLGRKHQEYLAKAQPAPAPEYVPQRQHSPAELAAAKQRLIDRGELRA